MGRLDKEKVRTLYPMGNYEDRYIFFYNFLYFSFFFAHIIWKIRNAYVILLFVMEETEIRSIRSPHLLIN